jgi:hypothetical protein
MILETPIVFHSQGVPLAGLFVRVEPDVTVRQRAVVVTGSWLTVKEQMPLAYARRLAALGYTAFVFDFAGFGQSGGLPRQTELPFAKMADISAAAEFVRMFSFVDPSKVGHLAICASAQYTLAALARGARIDAFASVAGWYHDTASIKGFYGGDDGLVARLGRGAASSRSFLAGEPQTFVPAYAEGDERAGMFFPLDYYANAERGAVTAWRNEMSEMTWLSWLTFDGIGAAEHVSTPTLFVHGDGCVLPDHVRRIHAMVKGEKELVWVQGNQVDFYDLPDHIDRAMAAVAPFFAKQLGT